MFQPIFICLLCTKLPIAICVYTSSVCLPSFRTLFCSMTQQVSPLAGCYRPNGMKRTSGHVVSITIPTGPWCISMQEATPFLQDPGASTLSITTPTGPWCIYITRHRHSCRTLVHLNTTSITIPAGPWCIYTQHHHSNRILVHLHHSAPPFLQDPPASQYNKHHHSCRTLVHLGTVTAQNG